MNPDGSYPGTCRQGLAQGKTERSVRIKSSAAPISFDDLIAGNQSDTLQSNGGDFVIRRADQLIAYQLCAAIDDARPNITQVVRGTDLLHSTSRQLHIQRLLGLASPSYAHIPVVLSTDGRKLSKHSDDEPVSSQLPAQAMRKVLTHLMHCPPNNISSVDGLFSWALRHWDIRRLRPR